MIHGHDSAATKCNVSISGQAGYGPLSWLVLVYFLDSIWATLVIWCPTEFTKQKPNTFRSWPLSKRSQNFDMSHSFLQSFLEPALLYIILIDILMVSTHKWKTHVLDEARTCLPDSRPSEAIVSFGTLPCNEESCLCFQTKLRSHFSENMIYVCLKQ